MDAKRPVFIRKPGGEEMKAAAAVLSHESFNSPYLVGWSVKNTFIEANEEDDEDQQPTLGAAGRFLTAPLPQPTSLGSPVGEFGGLQSSAQAPADGESSGPADGSG